MTEVIVYRLNNLLKYVFFCFIAVGILSAISFYLTREDKLNSKQMKIYGLLINLSKIDTLMLSISCARMLATIFCAINITQDIYGYIVIIGILSLFLIAYNFKKLIIELVNSVAPCLVLYLINILANYQVEVETNTYVSIIKTTLIAFVCLYSIYVFLTNLDDIVKKNRSIRRNENEKE